MSEEAPLEQPVDESQLVQNPEKAHAMALAGDEHRSEAMLDRVQAEKLVGDHELGSMREHYVNDSIENDKVAKELEEQAGQQYDADHPLATEGVATETGAASETSDASKEISEFISLILNSKIMTRTVLI